MFRGNSFKEVHTNIVKVTTIKISKHYCTKRGNKPSIFPSLTVQTKSVSPLNLIFLLIFPNPNLNRKSKQIATKGTSELKIEFDLYHKAENCLDLPHFWLIINTYVFVLKQNSASLRKTTI